MTTHYFEHPKEYKLLEVLGNGTYGVVCKAERTRGEGDAKTTDAPTTSVPATVSPGTASPPAASTDAPTTSVPATVSSGTASPPAASTDAPTTSVPATVSPGTASPPAASTDAPTTSVEVVAIKRITLRRSDHSSALRRLRTACRELEILQRLRHAPQIVHIEDMYWSEDEGYLYIVMQYVPDSAWKLLHQSSFMSAMTEPNCRRVAAQLFLGLHAMHSLKILHRDLSATNVLIDPNTCLTVIADFGLSKVQLEECNEPTLNIVTLPYRAPEVTIQCHDQSPALDMWSAGCIVMELATKRPFMFEKVKDDKTFLNAVIDVTGVPSPSDIDRLRTSHGSERFINLVQRLAPSKAANWKDDARNAGLSEDGISVLASIFVFDPTKRPTALEVLGMPWFTADEDCKNFIKNELARMETWLTPDYKASTEAILKEIEDAQPGQLKDRLLATVKKVPTEVKRVTVP
jgi:CTD kinase subunit alpha